MYDKDKRSFFEKLTGIINLQENQEDNSNSQNGFFNNDDNNYEEGEIIREQNRFFMSDETDFATNKDENTQEEQEKEITEDEIQEEEEIKKNNQENTRDVSQHTHETDKQEEQYGELAVDVYETKDEIFIQTMVAGVDPKDMEIIITRDMVTLKGRRDTAYIPEKDYYHKELYWGGFSRKILLPEEINPEKSEALEKHGLLILRLPKFQKQKVQKLKIQAL